MIIILIAALAVGQAAMSFVSQYHYVNEIKQYYKKEIRQELVEGKRAVIENRMLEEMSLIEEQFAHQDGASTLFEKE